MPDNLKQLETEKLRELVAALSRSSAYWSMESAYNDIVAIGSELLRREAYHGTDATAVARSGAAE